MSETEQKGGLELLLCEPEIVAWLDDYRPAAADESDEDGDPPAAA